MAVIQSLLILLKMIILIVSVTSIIWLPIVSYSFFSKKFSKKAGIISIIVSIIISLGILELLWLFWFRHIIA